MGFVEKENYRFDDLVEIVKMLRAPDGCPWDKVQTHKTIRNNFIEEVYEAIEAIDTDNTELLKEELGDVLLQVVFHTQMEEEVGTFNIDDVADGICKKLIIRHPHIFGNVKADNADEVLKNWDAIKMKTKSQASQGEVMQGISKALPSLIRSSKVQHKASKVGFDWSDVDGALNKVDEELAELREAIASGNDSNKAEELGDLLFAVVNVSRFIKADAEEALYNACEKFINRFKQVEQLAKERNIDMSHTNLSELDSLWDEVKIKSEF